MVLPELKINVADLGVDVRNNFEPVYVPLEGKAETLKRLKKLSEQCSRILLATGKIKTKSWEISWMKLNVFDRNEVDKSEMKWNWKMMKKKWLELKRVKKVSGWYQENIIRLEMKL